MRAPWIRPWALKKLRRAEGGGNIFGVFRVILRVILRQKILFSPILGGVHPPLGTTPTLLMHILLIKLEKKNLLDPS